MGLNGKMTEIEGVLGKLNGIEWKMGEIEGVLGKLNGIEWKNDGN